MAAIDAGQNRRGRKWQGNRRTEKQRFQHGVESAVSFYMGLFAWKNIADGLTGADIRGGVGHGRVSGVIAAEDVATVFKGNALDDVLVIGEARKANQRDLAGFGRGVDGGNDDVTAVDARFHAVAAGADDAEAGGIGVFAGNVGRFVRVGNGVEGQARSGGTENVNGFRGGMGIRRGDLAALERIHHLAKGLPGTIIKASEGTENGLCESSEPWMTRSTMSSVVSEASMGPLPVFSHAMFMAKVVEIAIRTDSRRLHFSFFIA